MEELFGNIFQRERVKSTESNREVLQTDQVSNDFIRKIIKRADIDVNDRQSNKKINNLYENITKDYAANIDKVVFHRDGKSINVKDTYLLNNLLDQNMFGGNYTGYCDNNVGQCSDIVSSGQCGGFTDFCDGQPSQCTGTQKGGFIKFCDGQPSQCTGSQKAGGSLSKSQFTKMFKKYTNYKISREALNSIHQMVENDLVHYLNNQEK